MDKRLLKRHKRQVLRAKEHAKTSEPDLRTPEQISAAREAARSATGQRNDPRAHVATSPVRNRVAGTAHSPAKADA
jgi:hypothetical protein